jgi:holliday junction DNA helicase RuvA
MIVSLDGTVAAVAADALVIDVAGVGYRVFAGPGTLAGLEGGSRVKLHIHHLFRDDAQALYGFRGSEELAFFELLLTVNGVGPKVGLAIVSSRPVTDLQLAVLQGDEAVLTSVGGVGRRLAARIVLELKEKVAAAGGAPSGSGQVTAESEVVAALSALGYTPSEAREAARAAVGSLPPGSSLEERVKAALRDLRRD